MTVMTFVSCLPTTHTHQRVFIVKKNGTSMYDNVITYAVASINPVLLMIKVINITIRLVWISLMLSFLIDNMPVRPHIFVWSNCWNSSGKE